MRHSFFSYFILCHILNILFFCALTYRYEDRQRTNDYLYKLPTYNIKHLSHIYIHQEAKQQISIVFVFLLRL